MKPKLRFKEFSEEWNKISIQDTFDFYTTNSLSRAELSDNGIIKNIHYGDIHQKFNNILNIKKETLPYIKKTAKVTIKDYCKNGDIVFADASEDYDGIGKAIEITDISNEKIVCGLHTIWARDIKGNMHTGFKGYLFNTDYIHNQIRILANGFKVFGISKTNLCNLKVYIPSKEEQKKIVHLLISLDKKIELQKRKIEALKLYSESLRNNILSQKIILDNCYFERKKLSDVLIKMSEKNKNNKIQYVESVSNKNGFIAQTKQFEDRSIASLDKSNYYIIKKGTFAYNPSRLNVGSLALKTNDVVSLVSPLYECFTTNQDNIYMLNWFKSNIFKKYIFSKFEGGVRNTLSFNNLCSINIELPPMKTQIKISNILSKFEDKLLLEEIKLNKFKELKKGLLQRMFI